jgi:hypothetical protein
VRYKRLHHCFASLDLDELLLHLDILKGLVIDQRLITKVYLCEASRRSTDWPNRSQWTTWESSVFFLTPTTHID